MTNRLISVLQHVPAEGLGRLEECLRAEKLGVELCRVFEGQGVPKEMGAFHGLVVLGGPMSVNDREKFPFLGEEMRLIEQALKQGKPVLGICLGSQM